MIRRRRPVREIAFSFDSFLDIVANVVGIIIRMILVVWVGARSYHTLQFLNQPTRPPEVVESAQPDDPLRHELEQHRRELAQAQARLLEQLRHLEVAKGQRPTEELAALTARRLALEQEKCALDRADAERQQKARSEAASLEELRRREQRLKEELAALERQPAPQALRYRAPVSRPVQSEELIFECKGGRVTFIDLGALLEEVRRGMRDKAELLRSRWEVSDVAGPVGAFQMRYTVERMRGPGLPVPDARSDFRYGVNAWQIEPVLPVRGEALDRALAPGSEFRRVVDVLDPQQTTVTFCVYPDSFAVFRRLRDYLYQRDLVVAGRPLPEDAAIAGSRNGTLSRGQ